MPWHERGDRTDRRGDDLRGLDTLAVVELLLVRDGRLRLRLLVANHLLLLCLRAACHAENEMVEIKILISK